MIPAAVTTRYPADHARAWVDIDLDAIVANAQTIASRAGRPLLPMVKANAYGLGAVPVARALEQVDPWGFGVATTSEAAELRAAGIDRRLIVFTPLQPAGMAEWEAVSARPVIGDAAALVAWTERTAAPFHVEIDTGMSRSGFRWNDEASLREVIPRLHSAPGFEGIFTHFHSSDCDAATTAQQWDRFQSVVEQLSTRPPVVHAANSAASLAGSRFAGDLVRPGIFLYGGATVSEAAPAPVAALRAPVVALRRIERGDTVSYGGTWRAAAPTTVATLGIGYADGVLRSLSGSGQVELGGRLRPIIGRVTMDLTMIEVSDHDVRLGDVATVYGGMVTLDAQATAAGTISYELLTALGSRVPRRYRGGA
ncbi:MAG TPA: alanine racemase [Gemmatimonadales bacterium]|nr:alanine racemase [Gemmatimonadales bacterium]